MEIMIPVWPQNTCHDLARKELRSLDGAHISFIDDNLDPELTAEIEQQLSAKYGAVIRRLVKPAHNRVSPTSLIDEAAHSEAVVVGVAMCGSCTPACVSDAVTLERRGVHTVTIVWETFERAARSAARVQGVPDMSFAVIPARRGSDTADDQRAKGANVAMELARQLVDSTD
jgi:hypothetical protein